MVRPIHSSSNQRVDVYALLLARYFTGHLQPCRAAHCWIFQIWLPARTIAGVQGEDGRWNIVVDEHDIGAKGMFGGAYSDLPTNQTGMELIEYSFDPRRQLTVPGDWNTQDPYLFLST